MRTQKILSLALSAAMLVSAMPVTLSAVAEETAPPSYTESQQVYTIVYSGVDFDSVEEQAQAKRAEYLSELEKYDDSELTQMVTECYQKAHRELMEGACKEAAEEVIAELGITDSAVTNISRYNPIMVCELTEEQLAKARQMDSIISITEGSQEYEELHPGSMMIDGGSLIDFLAQTLAAGGLKTEILPIIDGERGALIIYGLSDKKEISEVITQIRKNGVNVMVSLVENRCGMQFSVDSPESPMITCYVFVNDDYPDWLGEKTPAEFERMYGFDPLPYIINLGDTNGDYIIDASDASDVLSKYTELSTMSDPALTDELKRHFDVNADGSVDAADASAILAYYAYSSTGGDRSLKEFLRGEYSYSLECW